MNVIVRTCAVFSNLTGRARPVMFLLLLAGALSGCATKTASFGPIFFPPPPDEPHIQYLTGISNSQDLAGQKSGFSRFLSGGVETVVSFAKPYGMAQYKGKLYVADTAASQLIEVDFVKKTMRNLSKDTDRNRLKKPIGVAVDEDGNIYVADNGRKDIVVYNAAGENIKAYSKQLDQTTMVGVATSGDYLFALDNRGGKIYVLNRKSGELLTKIGEDPDTAKNMAMPNGIATDNKGFIYVVNMGNGSVKKYDRDGNMLLAFGKIGDVPGQFARPRGIAVDDDGMIFVLDAGQQVVQVFNAEHRILGFFGQPGLVAGSMNVPASVVVSKDNLEFFQKYAAPGFKLSEIIFVTNQYNSIVNHSLAVYGLGEMEGAKERAATQEKKDAEEKKLKEKESKPVKQEK